MRSFSTSEAARKCGIHQITLQRWVSESRIEAPKLQRVGGVVVRLWRESDLKRVRKHKQKNYRKGRGRKPKRKHKNGPVVCSTKRQALTKLHVEVQRGHKQNNPHGAVRTNQHR